MAIAAFLLSRPAHDDAPNRRLIAATLAGLTVMDLRVARVLWRAERVALS